MKTTDKIRRQLATAVTVEDLANEVADVFDDVLDAIDRLSAEREETGRCECDNDGKEYCPRCKTHKWPSHDDGVVMERLEAVKRWSCCIHRDGTSAMEAYESGAWIERNSALAAARLDQLSAIDRATAPLRERIAGLETEAVLLKEHLAGARGAFGDECRKTEDLTADLAEARAQLAGPVEAEALAEAEILEAIEDFYLAGGEGTEYAFAQKIAELQRKKARRGQASGEGDKVVARPCAHERMDCDVCQWVGGLSKELAHAPDADVARSAATPPKNGAQKP
jgi:hypothetical protein